MKARELIEKLSELDPETEIFVPDPGCGCCQGGLQPPVLKYEKDWWTAESEPQWTILADPERPWPGAAV